MCVCHHMPDTWCLRRSEESIRSHETRVSYHVDTKNQTLVSPEEQLLLLIADIYPDWKQVFKKRFSINIKRLITILCKNSENLFSAYFSRKLSQLFLNTKVSENIKVKIGEVIVFETWACMKLFYKSRHKKSQQMSSHLENNNKY